MFIRALSVSSVGLALLMSVAFAQQQVPTDRPGVRLPACSSSMIIGTWQAAFGYGTPIYGTAQNNGFSCPLTIAADGTVTSGTCVLGSGMTVSPGLPAY